jgi:hypothetical protein
MNNILVSFCALLSEPIKGLKGDFEATERRAVAHTGTLDDVCPFSIPLARPFDRAQEDWTEFARTIIEQDEVLRVCCAYLVVKERWS